jgi:N-acyl-D-amino-acid deacylase
MSGKSRPVDAFSDLIHLGGAAVATTHKGKIFGAFLLTLSFFVVARSDSGDRPFDVLIINGRILDGTGNPWFRADLGIRDGRVAAIGSLRQVPSARTIDVHNLFVTPGFIDMMAGDSLPLVLDRTSAASKLLQGVTTILVGEGDSPAPQNPETIRSLKRRFEFPFFWTNYSEYFDILSQRKIALNVIHNVGAAQIRQVVLGDRDVDPTPAQLARMEELVAEAMQQGAVGVSTALIYPPGSYAKTAEIIALAKVAARYDGIYFSHMRNESGGVLEAIDEVIEIARKAHIPAHIYHLKAAGQDNWSLVEKALDRIEEARSKGIEITADAYPYIYNGLDLSALIAPWNFAGGREPLVKSLGDSAVRSRLRREIETRADWENWYIHVGRDWDNVLVADIPQGVDPHYAGMSIAQIAKSRSVDPWTVFFDLVAAGNTTVNPKSMDEEQKREIYKADFVSISSDAPPSDPVAASHAHPRTFGTFPRILAKYVREEHVMSVPNAIRAMTSLPATQLKLNDRGRIALGMFADITIFDAQTVRDTATFVKPASYPVGILYVLVNGQVAVEGGKMTDALAGSVIQHHP